VAMDVALSANQQTLRIHDAASNDKPDDINKPDESPLVVQLLPRSGPRRKGIFSRVFLLVEFCGSPAVGGECQWAAA
jgi:hypothetical protein